MRLRLLFCLLTLSVLLPAASLAEEPRWGKLYTVTGNVPVRENPSDSAVQVRVLKAGQRVRVDFQDEGWAALFDAKEQERSESRALGYAKLSDLRTHAALDLAPAVPVKPGAEPRAAVRPASRPEARPEVKPEAKAELKAEAKTEPKKEARAEIKKEAKPEQKAESRIEVKAEPKAAAKPEAKPEAKNEAKPAAKAPAPAPKDAKASSDKGFGELRVADRQLTVRAARDKDSEFRRALKQGLRVRVDFQEDGWFAVFHPDEKVRELSRAWGFARDKYLVPESAYSGPILEAAPLKPAPAAPAPAKAPAAAPTAPAAKGLKAKAEVQEDDAVGYSVLERKDDRQKPVATVTMRVRLELSQAPQPDMLRKVVREIWKAERKKNENLQLEVLLTGMDPHGLAYAVARFHHDGRLREFWWREVVLGKAKK